MNSVRGLLNNVLPFSSVDGPGNRSVVFLQGCNLACVYCHNPYTIAVCTHCGDCVEPCPEDALHWVGGKVTVDWSRCTRCAVCTDVCPVSSTPLAESVTSQELLDRLRRTAPFTSGVTISGGEATVQPKFLLEFTSALRADPDFIGKTVLIDSNGVTPREVWDRLAPTIDGVMLDLKAWTDEEHRRITGQGNEQVIASAHHLADLGLLTELRLVLVPGWNDASGSIEAMADWMAPLGVPLKLIGVRHHGVDAPTFPEAAAEDLEEAAAVFRAKGVTVRVV